MVIDKEIKKRVAMDWQSAFPQLSLYAQDKLYKIVGLIIVGMELIKLPKTEEYRPHFVMYSLGGNRLGNNLKACLSGPIMLKEYYSKKGLQFSINYGKHGSIFNEVVDCVKEQTLISFEGDILLKKLLAILDEYSKIPPLSAGPNSYLQASLHVAKLKIALYVGIAEAQSILEQINQRN